MKRLIFSDLHLNTYAYGASVNEYGMNTRLAAQRTALAEMLVDVEEFGITHAYFGGDLFHTHGIVPTPALQVAGELFNDLRARGVSIRAMAGNHDMADRQGRIHALNFLPYDEISGSWVDGGLKVRALPYTDDEEILKQFLGDAGNDAEPSMLLLHQGVAGVPLSSGYVLDERLSADMIPEHCRAFTGHYHFHRAVSPNLTVIGNMTPLNWGDIDQSKGWLIWDDETGELEQRLQTSAPGFWSYDPSGDIEQVEGQFIRYCAPVTVKEQAEIRTDLLAQGALTVEFPEVKSDKKDMKIRTGDDLTIEHLVKDFENEEMPPRRKEVGLEVREGTYEAA